MRQKCICANFYVKYCKIAEFQVNMFQKGTCQHSPRVLFGEILTRDKLLSENMYENMYKNIYEPRSKHNGQHVLLRNGNYIS